MNLTPEDVSHGTLRDRVKIGSSLADVDPMTLDKSVNAIIALKLKSYLI